ncbi:MAG: response regulator [Burkholderiaceae bacterium]|nr:MAG: response regulator [Burkholderiaceae bacterium]
MSARILLVDDDPSILKLVGLRLSSAGYTVTSASSGEAAWSMIAASPPHLVITDLKMDGMDGLALFDAIAQRHPGLPVIILTAHGTIPDAVAATRRGVFGFLPKPFESQALLEHVEQALRLAPQAVHQHPFENSGLIAVGPAMHEVLHKAQLVAATDASIFITGASGTGKELLAHAIHDHSPRAKHAFVAINCAAIPEHLLESELFGHRKGAFSGATYDHPGLFLAAQGGTVFLDEIGDMPAALQAKLLRVLQEREVRAVGAVQSHKINVRVISATHRELEAKIRAGEFREDLYYRLNVVSLALPTLSERREDIPELANHFLRDCAQRFGKEVKGFAPAAMELLLTAPWPGNVRQLQNVVEQAVALATTPLIPAASIHSALRSEVAPLTTLDEARRAFEHDYLVRLLRLTHGRVSAAAQLAQRNRTEFYRLLERHKLDPKFFQTDAAASKDTPAT